jgi:methyl-galactoside transport system ATP-binding protein
MDTRGDGSYVLEMIGISKNFPGVRALDDVTLRVRPGTVHALMGENGAGKSTLMKCLFGIYHEDSGEVILKGRKVKFHSAKDALESGVSMSTRSSSTSRTARSGRTSGSGASLW